MDTDVEWGLRRGTVLSRELSKPAQTACSLSLSSVFHNLRFGTLFLWSTCEGGRDAHAFGEQVESQGRVRFAKWALEARARYRRGGHR
jgi:hypothetical protein